MKMNTEDGNLPRCQYIIRKQLPGPCITSDNFGGGQLAAERLTELGCQCLLFLRMGDHTIGEPDKREAGFKVPLAIQCFLDPKLRIQLLVENELREKKDIPKAQYRHQQKTQRRKKAP